MAKEDLMSGTQSSEKWYIHQKLDMEVKLTSVNENYYGQFGIYPPNQGYIQDFYPYSYKRGTFQFTLKNMQANGYIKIGQTKAINIDFTYMFPRKGIFVNVNMLLEFTL